jgi:acyl-coenzyme A thioesterase PaaI-like protein
VVFIRCGVEELFGVELEVAHGTATSRMPCGPWLSGPDGVLSAGALGVLADDTCGYAVNSTVPGGGWSATTELSLTLLRPLPAAGLVHGEATLAGGDAHGGVARAVLRDEAGDPVAFAHARNRFVGDAPPAAAIAAGRHEHGLSLPAPGEAADLLGLLGDVELTESGAAVVVGPRLGNPRGGLHGGMSLCLADVVAALAVPGLPTTGAQLHYLRPVPLGTRLVLEPVVRHRGRTFAVVEVVARREDGAECVRATLTRERIWDAAPSHR